MKHENFLSIKLLDERVVGKETYLFRYEIISNGPVQYCVRNSKYKKIISALNRSSLENYWQEYLKLKSKRVNPFRKDDILYFKADRMNYQYLFYQVIKVERMKVFLCEINVEEDESYSNFNCVRPLRNQFINEKLIEKKVEIIQVNGCYPKYGIKSESGDWQIFRGEYLTISKEEKSKSSKRKKW